MLYRVYVDEAGDRGVSLTSSTNFVVSAIIVEDSMDPTVRRQLATTRTALGRGPRHVIHFQKLTHSQRLKAAQDVAGFSVAAISNVVICKSLLGQPMPAGNVAFISKPDVPLGAQALARAGLLVLR